MNKEDLKFAKRTKKSFQSIKSGKGTRMDFDDFIFALKAW